MPKTKKKSKKAEGAKKGIPCEPCTSPTVCGSMGVCVQAELDAMAAEKGSAKAGMATGKQRYA